MNFESAMNAAARGKLVRRTSWPAEMHVFATASVVVAVAGGVVHTRHPVITSLNENTEYLADLNDQTADNWESVAPAAPAPISDTTTPAAAEAIEEPAPSAIDESAPAPEPNAGPEDESQAPAAAVSTEGEAQNSVSVDTSADAPAEEISAPVQEVMQDSRAPADANGVKEGEAVQNLGNAGQVGRRSRRNRN